MSNPTYSLFNDPSDTENNIVGNKEENKSGKPPINKNILKLADDSLNFIDQELTKSYKVTNIGTKPLQLNQKELKSIKTLQEDNLKSIGKSSKIKYFILKTNLNYFCYIL